MKVLDFDGNEFLSLDDIEFADVPCTVKRRSLRTPQKEWWDEGEAPRRFHRAQARRNRLSNQEWMFVDELDAE